MLLKLTSSKSYLAVLLNNYSFQIETKKEGVVEEYRPSESWQKQKPENREAILTKGLIGESS